MEQTFLTRCKDIFKMLEMPDEGVRMRLLDSTIHLDAEIGNEVIQLQIGIIQGDTVDKVQSRIESEIEEAKMKQQREDEVSLEK